VLQDFLAPELRAINARLDAQEKLSEARHGEMLVRIEAVLTQIESLKSSFAFDKRPERLENERRERAS